MDCAKLLFWCADSRFAEPRSSLKKVLIVAVRKCHCGVLIRGLQNLETPCKGIRVVTFCIVQKVTKKHARTCKKLPVASFCASETAETGRIANGREQGDHVSRRRAKGFNWIVRSCYLCALIRGLQNLDIRCKGNELSLFASCKK